MSYVIKAVLSNPKRPECGQITVPFPIPVDQYQKYVNSWQDFLASIGGGVDVRA